MKSLATCLKKAGKLIDEADADDLRTVTRDYEAAGLPHHEAAAKAIDDAIGHIRETWDTVGEQVAKAGGAMPAFPAQARPAVKPAEPEAKPADKIDDFGERLGGAKKDRVRTLATELTDDAIATEPFSKIWPAEDVNAIEDTFAAAVNYATRAEVPAKPRKGYKLSRWVENVKALRSLAQLIMRSDKTREQHLETMGKLRLENFISKVKLLEAIDRSQWHRIGTVMEATEAYSYDAEGNRVSSPFVHVSIDGRTAQFNGSGSVLDMIDRVSEKLGVAAPVAKMAFEVRGRVGAWGINKKGDKEYRKLKTFDDSKEALAYVKSNHDDLVAAWEGVKEKDNVKKTDVRREENRPRTAKDYRNGKPVTKEDFESTFGFRGVEFGNWVGQGDGAKARQGMLDQAYDALLDLAEIVGIPPKAISLNGSLGVGFGSRGSGKAAAHFEPGNLVINLTKTRGAGSLAHEWFHALDNYFARQRGGEVAFTGDQGAYRQSNYITYKPEPGYVYKSRPGVPVTLGELERGRSANPSSGYLAAENWILDPTHPEGVRPKVEAAFAGVVEALNASPMKARAAKNDKGADGYWSRIIELGARSFENYVISKMLEKGYHNDYLANVRSVEDFARDKGRYPYLLAEEVAPVAEAFDNLFDTIETKKTDTGTAMFSRETPGDSLALGAQELDAIVKGIVGTWKAAPPIRLHAGPQELPDSLQAEAKRQGVPLDEIVGVWHNGTVHLVASHPNLSTPGAVEEAIFHEALGHYGMRKVMGDDLRSFLIKLADDMGGVTGLLAEAKKQGIDLSDYEAATRDNPDVPRIERIAMLAEELGAHIAQKGPPALRQRIKEWLGAIKNWLRSHGFPFLSKYSDLDLANLLRRARGAVKDGTAFQTASDGAMFSRARNLTPEQKSALAKAGLAVDERTRLSKIGDWLKDETGKIKEALQDPDSRRQGLVDKFHGLRAAEFRAGGLLPVDSPYLAARNTTGLASVMEAILRYGAPEWRDGVLNFKAGSKGLLDALKPVEGDVDAWLGWMVGRRAKALKAQGRENLLDDADITALIGLAGNKQAEFTQAATDYLKLKNAILDVAQEAGIIDPIGRAAWDQAEYIPFYREDAGDTIGPGTRKGLAGQTSGIQTLKGGTQNLHDPLSNIVRNFTKLIDASMKNHAVLLAVDKLPQEFDPAPLQMTPALIPLDQVKKHLLAQGVSQATIDAMPASALKGVQSMLSITAPTAEDVVRVMRNGKAEYKTVKDPLLLRALTALKQNDKNPVIKPFIFAKRLLTAGVTTTAEFVGANFLRDSGAAWVMADDRFIPGWDSVKGAINAIRKDKATLEMMMAGSSFMGGQYYAGDPDAAAAALRRALRAKGLKNADIEGFVGTVARSPLHIWDAWLTISSALENANRNAVYSQAIKAGRSHAEAAFMAKDLMDFSMQGDSKFIQFFGDVLPFFNARLQGGYKLGRQAVKPSTRKRMAARGATIALASVGLLAWNLAMYGDAYDELEEWDKDTYWHIAPGTSYHLRIPKPFELGLAFGTVPERMYQAMVGKDTGKQSLGSLGRAIAGTMAMNPIPQGALPLVEQWANKRFFTGRPIENMGDEKLLPEAREEWYTSDTMKFLADHAGNSTGMGAKRLEHLWTGYTGGMGGYALDVSDWVLRQATDAPERPEMALREFPAVGRFLRGDNPPTATRFQTIFYDKLSKAEEVEGTIKDYMAKADAGDTDAMARAIELREQHRELLGDVVLSKTAKGGFGYSNVKTMRKTQQQLGGLRDEADAVAQSRVLTPEAKREKLDKLTAERNRITKDAATGRLMVAGGPKVLTDTSKLRLSYDQPIPKLQYQSTADEMAEIAKGVQGVKADKDFGKAVDSIRDTFKAKGEEAALAELESRRDLLGDEVEADVTYDDEGKAKLVLRGVKARREALKLQASDTPPPDQ